MELIFEVRDAEEGGYYARALGCSIFTQGDSWEDLRTNILEAVELHFEDSSERPRSISFHLAGETAGRAVIYSSSRIE